MGFYGKVTPDLMQRILSACGKWSKPWARLMVYITDKIVEGSRLGEVEAKWLADWMEREGVANPDTVLTVQLSRAQVSRELFKGQSQTTDRAITKLVDLGILIPIRTGYKGHGTLYLVGFVGVTKQPENVIESYPQKVTNNARNVTPTNEELSHVFEECSHVSAEWGHIQGPATCGNAGTFIDHSKVYSQKGGELRSREKSSCPRCGQEAIPFANGAMLDCRNCGAVRDVARDERMKAEAQINRIKGGRSTLEPLKPHINAKTGEVTSYL